MDTIATAEAVQLPVPVNTVQDVVELGVTVTVPTEEGFAPELAAQTKGPDPLAERT